MKSSNVVPYRPHPGKLGFSVTFQHPLLKRRVTRGLGTTIEEEALAICHDLNTLINDKGLWNLDVSARSCFDKRACEIFFPPVVFVSSEKEMMSLADTARRNATEQLATVQRLQAGELSTVFKAITGGDARAVLLLQNQWVALEDVLLKLKRAGDTETLNGVVRLMKSVLVTLRMNEDQKNQIHRKNSILQMKQQKSPKRVK